MNLKESTILITGMTGTLGSRVARRFLKEAREVRGLYRSKEQADQYAFKGVHAVIGELGDPDSLLTALQGVDLLIHCAAYLGDDPDLAQEANVTGVQHLADAATKARVKRIVHISTTSVYGEVVSGHFTETSPLLPSEHVASTIKRYRRLTDRITFCLTGSMARRYQPTSFDRHMHDKSEFN